MFQNWYSYFQRHIWCSFDGQSISCNECLSMFSELQLLSMKIACTCASIAGNVFVRCHISKTSFLQSDLNFEFRWCFSFSKVKIITTSNAYPNNIKPNIIQLRSLIWAGTKVRLDQLGSLTLYHLGLNEKRFFKSKRFNVCTDFTMVSLEIRA